MEDRHHVVFFSIADLIEMTAVTHTNILYAIALLMLSHAQKLGVDVAGDIRETVLGWNTTTHKQTKGAETKGELGFEIEFLDVFTAKLQREQSFRDELETKALLLPSHPKNRHYKVNN